MALAGIVLASVSACSGSSSKVIRSEAYTKTPGYQMPALAATVSSPCTRPALSDSPEADVADALAKWRACDAKHKASVAAYNSARRAQASVAASQPSDAEGGLLSRRRPR